MAAEGYRGYYVFAERDLPPNTITGCLLVDFLDLTLLDPETGLPQ